PHIYTLSLHDALPICQDTSTTCPSVTVPILLSVESSHCTVVKLAVSVSAAGLSEGPRWLLAAGFWSLPAQAASRRAGSRKVSRRSEEHTSELQSRSDL